MSEEPFLHKELSYEIVGLLYKVFNTLGYGYREKYYERAFAKELRQKGFQFEGQKPIPLLYEGEVLGKYFIDFVIENKIVLELKISNSFRLKDFQQIVSYLRANNLKLGLLVAITRQGIRYRRILNTR